MNNFNLLLCVLISFFLSNTTLAIDQNYIIKQGKILVTFEDVDGYSYTMPEDNRNGFFESPERIDTTISTLLTMKHIMNYAGINDILNDKKISNNVGEQLLGLSDRLVSENLSDLDFLKLKKYLKIVESYKFVQSYIKNSVTEEDVKELSLEEYEINKQKYYNDVELRNIQYINILYNDENKDKQYIFAKKIQKELINNLSDFKNMAKKYESDEGIIFISGINDFYYNEKYKAFSDLVFNPESTGLIDDILDAKSRYIVAIVNHISPKGFKSYDSVKKPIIDRLKSAKVKRKFGDIITKLTTDTVEINKEAILSLRTRYVQRKN